MATGATAAKSVGMEASPVKAGAHIASGLHPLQKRTGRKSPDAAHPEGALDSSLSGKSGHRQGMNSHDLGQLFCR